ncbi:MAG TPA: hypothetical protein VH370_00890 [Humisphaera sp.]|jgi:hypothetical protein|nr:hypothetical protein [Humisphaera sp.]
MSDSQNSDRRRFLDPLVQAIGNGWTAGLTIIAPFNALGVEIRHPEISGYATVVPCTAISPYEIHYELSENGIPLYQLALYKSDGGVAHLSRYQRPAEVIEALNTLLTAVRPARFSPRPMHPQWIRSRTALYAATQSPADVRKDLDSAMMADLTDHAKGRLSRALDHLSPGLLARNAPRDEQGRLELKSEILLAQLGAPAAPSTVRFMWLYAAGPLRRRDEQVLTLRIADLIPQNAEHRWDAAPWLWQSNVELPAFEANILSAARGNPSSDATVAQALTCLALLDQGEYPKAFNLYGVQFTEALLKGLMGQGPTPRLQDVALRQEWADVLHRQLWETAPWAVAALVEKIRAERFAQPGGKTKAIESRLFNLPHQTQQRKAGLALVVTRDNSSLDLTWSASNARVPQIHWKRPLAIDAARSAVRR